MHTLLHVVMALVLLIGCGIVTRRFFSFQLGIPFAFDRTLWRSRYFWLGLGVALVFLWSDFRFERYFSLAAQNIL